MATNTDLLVWSPSRSSKFTRIEYPAVDDSDQEVNLYDGANFRPLQGTTWP